MILDIFLGLLTATLFLFVFWRRLKEDYAPDQVFSTGFYILLGISVGALLAVNFRPTWWFWSGLSGALLGLSIGVERFRLRLFEALEAAIYGGLILCAGLFLREWAGGFDVFVLWLHLGVLFLILVFEFLNLHYKKFTWYKSGRVGFSGLTVAGIFFILRAVVASYFPNTVSFIGKSDVILSGIFAFVSFISVYNLSKSSS